MEETLTSQKMAKIDLINSLEKISSEIPDRILKLEGFIQKENQKEQLEIIIFRGFSSSTTHPIDCLLYTSPSPRDLSTPRMPSSA